MRRACANLLLLLVSSARPLAAAPVTEAQLLEMGKAKVAPKVMLAIVERDCVDFDVDGGNVVELSKAVPAPVLEAAIRCRQARTKPASEAAKPAAEASPAAEPVSGPALLKIEARFISESGPLACEISLDGKPWKTLSKPPQGKFGEAVARDPYDLATGFEKIQPGTHEVAYRCDPMKAPEPVSFAAASGQRWTLSLSETMFKRWRAATASKSAESAP
jgi:hypothetical protein